jgi:hypothetical protein
MKKYAIISLLVIPLLLSGCSVQRKTTDTTATATATGTSSTDTNPAIGAQASETAETDSAAIETQYQTNFTTATTDANQILQNKAKFCSVMVKFSDSKVTAAGDQFFFFSSDELLTDYYWVVEFDGLNSNKKKRYFAARRDFKDEITCVATQPKTPPSYTNAFTSYLAQYTIPDTTANLQIALQDATWDILARDTTGTTTSNGQVPVATATTTKTKTTSPVASQTADSTDSSI